jgi:hypothetical protein
MKYKNLEETTESEVMTTSGPVFKERSDPDRFNDPISEETKDPERSNEKMIVIKEKDGSISFSIDDNWAAYEVIGALEMVKGTVLNRVNPQAPSIMDRILMNSGIK